MTANLATATTTPIAASRTDWIRVAGGEQVLCTGGCLWLTYDGQQRDIILERGQAHVSDGAGRLAIHALQEGSYLVRPQGRPAAGASRPSVRKGFHLINGLSIGAITAG